MIRHLLKNIYGHKVASLLLFLLLSATSFILLQSVDGLAKKMRYYFQPRGYNLQDVSMLGTEAKKNDENGLKAEEFYNRLKASPLVEKVALGNPKLIFQGNEQYQIVGYKNNVFSGYLRTADEAMGDVLKIKMRHGRWLKSSDQASNGVVISTEAAIALFGRENVVSQSFSYNNESYKVVGVCNSIRQNKWSMATPTIFLGTEGAGRGMLTIRFKEGMEHEFALSLEKLLASAYGANNYIMYYDTLENQDHMQNQAINTGIMSFLMKIAFLITVALFSFLAVIWYMVEARAQEWCIRYVLGRTRRQIVSYVFLENFLLFIIAFICAFILFINVLLIGNNSIGNSLTLLSTCLSLFLLILFLLIGVLVPTRKIKRLDISELLKSE